MSNAAASFNSSQNDSLLKINGLEKTFEQAGQKLTIFQDLALDIRPGEIVALVGPSGAGKSTLLQIAGLLDRPTGGEIWINKKPAHGLSDIERTRLRREFIGFVYQFHHLLPEFTALENVALPQIIRGAKREQANDRAAQILGSMGLAERLEHRPARLSGGEQQRTAIARALANDPALLFADEPTGNLDVETSDHVFDILVRQVRERGIGALVATHNLQLAERMDRILQLKGGKIVSY